MRQSILLLFAVHCLAGSQAVAQQRRILEPELHHLRSGERREWSTFPETADGERLVVRFDASANDTPSTLGLRRIDVKEGWRVTLNGSQIAKLFSDENDMQEVWQLESGQLHDGENQLVIEPTGERVDDIRIGEIWLDPRPKHDVLHEAQLQLLARDESGESVPCRFTILDEDGSLAAIGAESGGKLAVRSGVVYSADGRASVGLARGSYTVFCGRGFEYSLDQTRVVLNEGASAEKRFQIRRVVDTEGWVACDPHVHTFEVSRHGDASLQERMVTLVGEGIELPIATDHNIFVDYRPHLQRLGLSDHVTPVIGNEVTTPFGHFNILPAKVDTPLPKHQSEDWRSLRDSIFATPTVKVAILNHPRDVHAGFTPFAAANVVEAVGERMDGRIPFANAVELINSAALQTDPMVVFHDWVTRVNRGQSITAVGTSDSHEVSRKIVGQGRTYLRADDSDPGSIDVDAAVKSLVEGQAIVCLGLLVELTVNGQAGPGDTLSVDADQIGVSIRVQGPEWVRADTVELYSNGQLIRRETIPEDQESAAGVKAAFQWRIEKPAHDVHLVAVARGPGVTGLYWPIAKAYQPTSIEWRPYLFGSSGVVRLDNDGDGTWTAAKRYAEQTLQAAGGDFSELVQRLSSFDRATATFAAHAWERSKGEISQERESKILQRAPAHVRSGFDEFRRSQRESLSARFGR